MTRAVALLAALAGVFAPGGCAPRSPEGVADRFMDLYFIEFDQERLIPLTTGLAREKIDREISLVRQVRNEMGRHAAKSRSEMHYRRLDAKVEGDEARLSYTVDVKGSHNRLVSLALHRQKGLWLVGNFVINDGDAPAGK